MTTRDGCSGSSSGNTCMDFGCCSNTPVAAEVELLLVMAVFAEVLPDDFGCAKGCMGPPCGATVIILPFFFVFVFLAAGSFDAAKINGNTDNFPYSTCLFFLCLWKFTIQRLS